MTILHTVNKSPFERNSLQSCIDHAKEGSAVLFFEDGIYGALQGTEKSGLVTAAMKAVKFYVLGPDLKARGISEDKVISGIKVIDYDDFVDLVTEHSNTQSWL